MSAGVLSSPGFLSSLWCLLAVASFHLAWAFPRASGLLLLFFWSLLSITQKGSARQCFYAGFAAGMGIYGYQLHFFWILFGPAATALWAVLAVWLGCFMLLAHAIQARINAAPLGEPRRAWLGVAGISLAWLGLEYFRSELYPLRFSWITPGSVFAGTRLMEELGFVGVHGLGAILIGITAAAMPLPRKMGAAAAALAALALGVFSGPASAPESAARPTVRVGGIQAEFPTELEVPRLLDDLLAAHPDAELLALGEYTLEGPPPKPIREWCRSRQRHLIIGGKEPAPGNQFYNTAFVIDSKGEVVFRQAKAVPIQFFKDGLPAPEQRVWESPWGRLGIGICYDMSYVRVMDRLIAQGAQALIIPTMDIAEWGEYQHELHARIAPIRAAEYRVPVLRVATSGISQLVAANGSVVTSAPFGYANATLGGDLPLAERGRKPLDRWIGPVAGWAAVAAVGGIFARGFRANFRFTVSRARRM